MTSLITWFHGNFELFIRALLILVIGYPLIRLTESIARRMGEKRLSQQSAMLLSKGIRYCFVPILIVSFLKELGFNLSAILGVAGIAGVAIGFAAQTSLSNLISGIFLIAEKSFEVGDALQLGDTIGQVFSIDLLSVKLRTFDNKFVRIPNEVLVKAQFTNITRFPIRRLDIDIGVAYKENVEHVVRVLAEVADKNPFSLDEPEPLILFKGFGESSLDFLLGVWFAKTDMLSLRNSIMTEIKNRFDEEGIEIPFPHRSLYAGSATEPFPIRIVSTERKPNGDSATESSVP